MRQSFGMNGRRGGHTVTSNLIYMGSSTAPSALCFDPSTYTIAQFKAFDNNLCFRAGGASYGTALATLRAAMQAGFDVHGLSSDPLLAALPSAANGYSVALGAGSPAARAGNRTLSAPTDYFGRTRPALPDIGAFQSGSGPIAQVPPAAPTSVQLK